MSELLLASNTISMQVVYEDNHIIIVNKRAGEIVQGDKTGDKPLSDMVREYIKEKYAKPGNVFCGVVHRIDRPVSGLVVFARTSKALERLNKMFRDGKVSKTYRVLVEGHPEHDSERLERWLRSDGRINKTFITRPNAPDSKLSALEYRVLVRGDRYSLLEVRLLSGRKHQIRAMLADIGHPVKGDLKYGARRSNPDGGISLQAYRLAFTHPVSGAEIDITAPPLPDFLPFLDNRS